MPLRKGERSAAPSGIGIGMFVGALCSTRLWIARSGLRLAAPNPPPEFLLISTKKMLPHALIRRAAMISY